MKKFKRLKPEVYDIIEANLEKTLTLLKETQSPYLTLQTLADIEDPFEDSVIDYKELSFIITSEKPIDDDFHNAKMIFEGLKITPQQATDKYLWSGIAFNEAHLYLSHRWGLNSEKSLAYRWIAYTNTRRALFFNGLSRLWWYYKLTFNESLPDTEAYTKMIFSNIDTIANLIYRNLSSSRNVRMAYLKYIYDLKLRGYNPNKELLLRSVKELSLLGGSLILDSLTEDEIYEYLNGLSLES